MSPYSSSSDDDSSGTGIAALHPDIIETHILTRLDGPTLASAACASTLMHALCTQETFWRDICKSTWNSISDPHVRDTISTFPSGYRSFFSDSFSTLRHDDLPTSSHNKSSTTPSDTTELISAVDILYNNKPVFSKVRITETDSDFYCYSPFWVDLLDPKEAVVIRPDSNSKSEFDGDEDAFLADLERSMKLSWIVIDPTRKRSANLSSLTPVSVRRHWGTGDLKIRYATVMGGSGREGSWEKMMAKVVVTCGVKEGGELHVKDVNLHMQDLEGWCLSGTESLVILQEAMESGERVVGRNEEERKRYEEFQEVKRERRVRKKKMEQWLDVVRRTVVATIIGASSLALCMLS